MEPDQEPVSEGGGEGAQGDAEGVLDVGEGDAGCYAEE